MPSIPDPSARGPTSARRRARRAAPPRRGRGGGPASTRQRDRRTGRPGVAAAAERPGQDRRVDAAGLRPDAEPGAAPASLKMIATSAVVGLGQQVDDPLGVGRDRAGRREVGVEERGPDDPPVGGRLEPVEDAAEQAQLAVGLGAVEPPRDVRERRARPRRAPRPTASVRGVAFGWANVAVSITMPAISAAASAPRPSSSGTPSRARQQRGHLAGRGGRRVDPVGRAGRRRSTRGGRWTTRGRRCEQLRVALGTAPMRSSCRSPTRRAGRSRRRAPGPSGRGSMPARKS